MPRTNRLVVVAVVVLHGSAAAEHDHGPHGAPGEPTTPRSSLALAVGVQAAAYDSMFFEGDYQGLGVAARFARGRFGASASVVTYRLTKNGKTVRGLGDTIVGGSVVLVERGGIAAGVALAAMLPTGADLDGLGMGHTMAMPGAFARWTAARVQLSATLGFHQGLGDESLHAEHGGVWPLVDPMNYAEVTYGATATYSLATALRAGLHVTGAVPTGAGDARLVGGVRAVWIEGRVETAFEVQAGLAGDPFSLRGLLETAIRFP